MLVSHQGDWSGSFLNSCWTASSALACWDEARGCCERARPGNPIRARGAQGDLALCIHRATFGRSTGPPSRWSGFAGLLPVPPVARARAEVGSTSISWRRSRMPASPCAFQRPSPCVPIALCSPVSAITCGSCFASYIYGDVFAPLHLPPAVSLMLLLYRLFGLTRFHLPSIHHLHGFHIRPL